MEINLDTLIPFDLISESPEDVFKLVDTHGQVILLQNNKPAYIIMKTGNVTDSNKINMSNQFTPKKYKLHEAMQLVLREAEGNQMHAAELAEEIYRRGLYLKNDGSKAEYNQIAARARYENYKGIFEVLPGNIIKLI